ncbi:hypothetical protein BWI96_09335 [Siphonobacter sp. SORGH_AS_0500]|nr:hypothetical protein BWI96_09335 [Siphonobacter sp. SORGH_AS_0500]
MAGEDTSHGKHVNLPPWLVSSPTIIPSHNKPYLTSTKMAGGDTSMGKYVNLPPWLVSSPTIIPSHEKPYLTSTKNGW